MTLEELTAQFRIDADDTVEPYQSGDEQVTLWLNEAVEEAANRASLIHEADNPEVCEIAVTAGTGSYAFHSSLLYLTHATFTATGSTEEVPLELTDRHEQDRVRPGWRRLSEAPRSIIQNDKTVQLTCLPSSSGLLRIEGYRMPIDKLVNDSDEPEVAAIHHRHLVHWPLFRHYSRPDAEIQNPGAAASAEKAFTAMFGPRPDADVRRSFQANRPIYNKAVW